MTARKQVELPEPGYSERTGDRIRAFLASMRPLDGSGAGDDKEYHRGRSLIERLALSATEEDDPTLRLGAAQCADVLNYLGRSEPIEERDWWKDPRNAPNHVIGYEMVLRALERSLRDVGSAQS